MEDSTLPVHSIYEGDVERFYMLLKHLKMPAPARHWSEKQRHELRKYALTYCVHGNKLMDRCSGCGF